MTSTLFRCEALYPRAGEDIGFDRGVAVRDNRVIEVSGFSSMRERHMSAEIIDLPGLTLPGFVDAHSHLRSRAAVQQATMPDRRLEAWIYSLPELTPLPGAEDSLAASAELLRAGVTSVQIMLHSWSDMAGRLQELSDVVQAVSHVGLRALLVLGLTDQDEFVPDTVTLHQRLGEPQRGLAPHEWRKFVAAAEELIAPHAPLIQLGVGPVAPQWCSDEALRVIAESRGAKRVHAHALESSAQRGWSRKGHDQIRRLAEAGLLGPFTSLAHAAFATREQLTVIARAGASLVHCHTSNASLTTGHATVEEWVLNGIPTAMGLDSQVSAPIDFPGEVRACADTHFEFSAAFAAATLGGAEALGEPVGQISRGAWADLISIDCDVSAVTAGIEALLDGTVPFAPYSVVVAGRQRFPLGTELDRKITRAEERLTHLVAADAAARRARLLALTPELRTLGFISGDDK
ncbi:amidohydrolase family protein [Leucobacter aridicollis]|uniref:Cytosine/adenosine deaminase-related metal-dependent hydrolase n=1 Tax=Leucobacter aridicollis TaxID=283878 RepID=A0A852R9L3_9MICO|nr:amidohydrolase family protein [Leucobacter aridicollis]NYD28075.1 cytosine/adenosine deaminase-related metal-dependent hydrolase [Leucobacter aridicollis]